LGAFAISALVEFLPLQEVFDRLAPELDEMASRSPRLPTQRLHDRDTTFSHRVETALANLSDLRERGPVDAETPDLPVAGLHPLRWAEPPQGDVLLRVAVAIPVPVTVALPARPVDQREKDLLKILTGASITRWLRGQRDIWHWTGEAIWAPTAGDGSTLFEFLYAPQFPGTSVPLSARCCVQVGIANNMDDRGEVPAVQIAIDLIMNVLELDADRHPSSMRHETAPPPAPGALKSAEIAEALVALLAIRDLVEPLATTVSIPIEGGGELGMWLVLNSLPVDRVLDLSNLERRSGAATRSEWSSVHPWPLPPSLWGVPPERAAVAAFLQQILETSGFRNVALLTSKLRNA